MSAELSDLWPLGDTVADPARLSEEDMRDENRRIQSLEKDVLKNDALIKSVDCKIDDLNRSVGRIQTSLERLTPHGNTWVAISGMSAAASVVVAVIGIAITSYQAQNTRKSVQGQITRLQSDIRMLAAAVAPPLVQEMGPVITAAIHAPANEIAERLKQPTEVFKALRQSHAGVSLDQLHSATEATKELVQQRREVKEVWGMAAELVNYRSEVSVSLNTSGLPSCLSLHDPSMDAENIYDQNGQQHLVPGQTNLQLPAWTAHAYLDTCVLDLDDDGGFNATAIGRYFVEVRKHHPNLSILGVALNHAVIRYRGGKMIPINEIRFENCIFELGTPPTVPPRRGQVFTERLLAVNPVSDTFRFAEGM